jgi:hypothetical protein
MTFARASHTIKLNPLTPSAPGGSALLSEVAEVLIIILSGYPVN